jgi:hypothetical protein
MNGNLKIDHLQPQKEHRKNENALPQCLGLLGETAGGFSTGDGPHREAGHIGQFLLAEATLLAEVAASSWSLPNF